MKKFVLGLAAMALIFASCAKNEVEQINEQNPDVISFSSTTARATINNLATLQADAAGFQVLGKTTGASSWFSSGGTIDGTNNYGFAASAWGWVGTPAKWPLVSTDYPMDFYAIYPPSASVTKNATTPTITDAITIAGTVAAQKDLLAAKASTASKPADGKLSLTFKHILSKINIGVIAGNGKTVIIQEAGAQNVYNKASYDYVAGTWLASPVITGNVGYEYFKGLVAAAKSITGVAAETAEPIYAAAVTNAHMMLMPQTHASWNPTSGTVSNSYISMTYRLKGAAGDEVGYTDATDYLTDYPDFVDVTAWSSYSGISSGATPYGTKPFYIKVGFPLATAGGNFTWAPGKGYTYNLCLGTLGSSNGYYVDDTYYDEDGNDTGIPIKGIVIGDPVSDGIINFKVDVTDWDNTAPIPLQ